MADLRTTPRPADAPALPPYRRSRGPFIALLVLLAVGVAAVVFLLVTADDDDVPGQSVGTPATATTPPPPTTLDPDAATKAEIEDVHRRASEIAVEVASDPNGQPDDPRLAQYKKGTALAAAQLGIRRLRGDGHVLNVSRLERNPRVVKLGPETAVVEDCSIDVSSIVDEQSGQVIEPAGPPSRSWSSPAMSSSTGDGCRAALNTRERRARPRSRNCAGSDSCCLPRPAQPVAPCDGSGC